MGNTPRRYEGITEHVVAILRDPDTPAYLHNSLLDAVNEFALDAKVGLETPEVARVALPLMFQKIRKQDSEPTETGAATEGAEQGGQSPAGSPDGPEGSAFTWRDERNAVPKLTPERARELVLQILDQDNDEQARALIELVTGIAYDQEHVDRDGCALWATHAAYSKTMEFSIAAERFATKAAMRN